MAHPLTDEVCNSIAPWSVQGPCGHTNMRAAADWQLEQVIDYLEYYKMVPLDIVLRNIRIAMRPQEDN